MEETLAFHIEEIDHHMEQDYYQGQLKRLPCKLRSSQGATIPGQARHRLSRASQAHRFGQVGSNQ
ncbi:hypothetical protein LINPERPRIM_LOCUS8225 [Linum perenne]